MHPDKQKQLLEPKLLLKISNFTNNSKPLKNPALLGALQFQLSCGIHPIVQLLSLKLPMDSPCIQATNSKSISVPNITGDFHIYTARQSSTLTKVSK